MCLFRIPLRERPMHAHCASLYGGIFKTLWTTLPLSTSLTLTLLSWQWFQVFIFFYIQQDFFLFMNFLFKMLSYYQGTVNKSLLQRGPASSRPYPADITMKQKPLIIGFFFQTAEDGLWQSPLVENLMAAAFPSCLGCVTPESNTDMKGLSLSLPLLIFRQWFKNRLESHSILQRGLLSYQSSWKPSRCLTVRTVLSLLNSENNSSVTTMVALTSDCHLHKNVWGYTSMLNGCCWLHCRNQQGNCATICIMRLNCVNSAEEFNWQSQPILSKCLMMKLTVKYTKNIWTASDDIITNAALAILLF